MLGGKGLNYIDIANILNVLFSYIKYQYFNYFKLHYIFLPRTLNFCILETTVKSYLVYRIDHHL